MSDSAAKRQESLAIGTDDLVTAEQRVYTNDLDALEALIVEGLPPDEMQAAAWVLVQRVRGLQADLVRVEKARVSWAARAAR